MESYLHFAKSVVREASLLVKGMTHQSAVKYSKDLGDIVTSGDLAVHEYILGRIRDTYPEHGFLSEEGDDNRTDTDYVWILDPIDGTKYFAREVPLYAVSLALRVKDELVVGVVHNPETQQMFAACSGAGATLNGLPIGCSQLEKLEDCIICVEAPNRHDPKEEREWGLKQLQLLTDNVLRVRLIGVAAHSLCWTAMGGFDAYVNLKRTTKIWDIAASQVILQEAGGKLTDIDGRMVGGPPVLHDKFLELLDL